MSEQVTDMLLSIRQSGCPDCAALRQQIERLQQEVMNRNQRALEGDKAVAVRDQLVDTIDSLQATLARVEGERKQLGDSHASMLKYFTTMRLAIGGDSDTMDEAIERATHLAQAEQENKRLRECVKEWYRLWDMNELEPHYNADSNVMNRVLSLTKECLP